VQQAQVPPIAQVNRKVPPELERIVNKSLAKDNLQRYGTARELGQDLIRFLYAYGQAIGTFDIATIVQSTMREKQRVRPPQGSIIDKLIEEALFEFTSLKEDGAQSEAGMKVHGAAAPLNPDQFVDPTNWAEEIAIANKPSTPHFDAIRASLPGEVFEQGNLSALEEEPPRSASAPPPHSVQQMGLGPHSSSQPTPSAHRSGPHSGGKDKSSGGSGAAIGVVLFLVVAAAAGAAWFSGLIPHQ
jgi:hypothetical protein